MTIDLYLRAGNAGAFASACPWLRGEDVDGSTFWITGAEGFSFDPIGAVLLKPGVYDEAGEQIDPPQIDERFHSILRCTPEFAELVPDIFKLDYADAPRKWAADAVIPEIVVPESVTMRQARMALLAAGLLDDAEAAIGAMTGTEGRVAQIEWEYATELRRDHPLVAGLGRGLGLDAAAIDGLFVRAARIV